MEAEDKKSAEDKPDIYVEEAGDSSSQKSDQKLSPDSSSQEPQADLPKEEVVIPSETTKESEQLGQSQKNNFLLLFVSLSLGLIIGGTLAYFWYQKRKTKQVAQIQIGTTSLPSPSESEDELLENLNQQSNSDDLPAIEEDLINTDLTGLDQEMTEIEEEFSSP